MNNPLKAPSHDLGASLSFGLRRLVADQSGSAMVELALMIALVGLPLLLGLTQVSILTFDSIEVANAAHAAAGYGMSSATLASDVPGMMAAARAEAPDIGVGLVVVPTTFYVCSTNILGIQYLTQALAQAACTGTLNHGLQLVSVTVTASITPVIYCPGLPRIYTLSNVSVMEVEE